MRAQATAGGIIAKHLGPTNVVVGLGNVLRSDDGLGPRLVQSLAGAAPDHPRVRFVDAGGGLENHLGQIIRHRPAVVLIVDAVELGRPAGEIQVLAPEDLDGRTSGTHDFSLPMLAHLLARHLPATKLRVLAVQPGSTAFGEQLSPEVSRALRMLETEIREVL